MHMHCLKLQRPTVWEEMHLQDNTFFDLDLGRSQEMLPSTLYVTYAAVKFEIATSNS